MLARLLTLLLLPVLGAQVPAPPEPAREFRGAWVATVDNIDWPSQPGLPVVQQQRELDAILDRARELHLDALLFQVRSACDAFYASELEPWSEWLTGVQGRAPEPAWDPLAYAVKGAHARGLELHAWCNPFRARPDKAKSGLDRMHPARREPGLAVSYGDLLWLDPGNPRARDWSLRVIADLVTRYDVDGVHLDDYFYPYPEKRKVGRETVLLDFPDDASWARYRADHGTLPRADWRRASIDDFLQKLEAVVHAKKPWVRLGISPFGIARPGDPPGIQAGIDQYAQLYADPRKWLASGLCDYLAPQLYWPIDQKAQSFAVLLPWWAAQNPKGRLLMPGLYATRALQGGPPWRKDEIPAEIAMIRAQPGTAGFVLFSFKALLADNALTRALPRLLPEPALTPASAWLGGAAPPAPVAELARGDVLALRWQPVPEQRFAVVQELRADRWRTVAICDATATSWSLSADGPAAVALRLCGRSGLLGPPVVLPATVPRR